MVEHLPLPIEQPMAETRLESAGAKLFHQHAEIAVASQVEHPAAGQPIHLIKNREAQEDVQYFAEVVRVQPRQVVLDDREPREVCAEQH